MFDFHSAYLNGILNNGETIYMEQPPYHEVADRSCYVMKLCKSLYGLKQASRKWYDTLSGSLAAIGFQKSMADPAVLFVCVGSDVVILFIHVDDTTITGSSMDLSGFHQVALWLGPNGLRPQGLKEYSDDYLALDYLGPIMGSKCLVMQTTGNYLRLGPLEETSGRMFQVATQTFNLLCYFPFMYTHWSHFSG
jgi:hypothetical protein